MADRQYRQRGYREPPDKDREKPEGRPASRPTGMLPTQSVVRCADCGTRQPPMTDPQGQCPKCGAALHACQQCTHFNPSQRFECSQPITERITDKRAHNACTFFALKITVERETSAGAGGADDARRALKDLFKK